MRTWFWRVRAGWVAALLAAIPALAGAAEIRVFSTGAFRPVLDALVPAYETRTGDRVTIETDTAGGVAQRIERGEPFDLAVLTPATSEAPVREGKLILVTPIASVGIGVAVRTGAPKPDIATTAALRAALLAAPAVAMVDPASGGTSGIYLAKLFERLGIAEQMKPKLVLTQGGLSAERVAAGQATLALGQASELLAVPGVTLVGPLPAEVQSRAVYVAGLNPKSGQAPLILLAALAGPETKAILPQKGMGPP